MINSEHELMAMAAKLGGVLNDFEHEHELTSIEVLACLALLIGGLNRDAREMFAHALYEALAARGDKPKVTLQ